MFDKQEPDDQTSLFGQKVHIRKTRFIPRRKDSFGTMLLHVDAVSRIKYSSETIIKTGSYFLPHRHDEY